MTDPSEALNATQTNIPVLFLGYNGEWWDTAMVLSLTFAAVAAFAVVATTVGSIRVHKLETTAAELALRNYQAEMSGKVADATAAGIVAGRAAGEAAGVAKRAEADIAVQKTLTAQAQLETEKLKYRLAWRELSSDQMNILINELSKRQISVSVLASSDPEALTFGGQIVNALRAARVTVTSANRWLDPPVLPTDFELKGNASDAEFIQQALKLVDLTATIQVQDGPVVVGLLSKPRAF